MRKRLLLAAMLAAVTAGATQIATGATVVSCKGSQLTGTFTAIAGSAGAGNISYRLALKNVSTATCTLTGLPQGRLLGKTGNPLPTHVHAAFPGALTAVLVHVAPGKKAYASARFSPDVNGTGDHAPGRCQPIAYWFRVTGQNGPSTTKAKIAPPTSVCERGSLSFSAYSSVPGTR